MFVASIDYHLCICVLQRDLQRMQNTKNDSLESHMTLEAQLNGATLKISQLEEERECLVVEMNILKERCEKLVKFDGVEIDNDILNPVNHEKSGEDIVTNVVAAHSRTNSSTANEGYCGIDERVRENESISGLLDMKISKLNALTERLLSSSTSSFKT